MNAHPHISDDASRRAEAMLWSERARADHMLGWLLLAQVPLGIGLAALHGTWILAVVAGSALGIVPLLVTRAKPGTFVSRMTVAAAFMGFSILFIQETHGMTEWHFAVFVGLAFLLLYRDWRVPVFGGALIAVHHLGFWLLQRGGAGVWVFERSMTVRMSGMTMGGHLAGIGMVLLHAAFVVFEVAVLAYMSVHLSSETRRQAQLLVEQERGEAAMRMLAERLHARDLSLEDSDGSAGDDDAAIGTLRDGIGQVAELVRSIERTASSVATASVQMADMTAEAGRAGAEISGSLAQMADGAQRQVQAVGSARESASQVGHAVELSTESARRTAEAAAHVQQAAEQGADAAERAASAAQAVAESSSEATRAIGDLAQKSEQIATFVDTITGIAGQTNLLALNAAIEAARAGESGRGFAVVAEEVRKLAEESQRAAATINDIVSEIQQETKLAVAVVQDSAQRTDESAAAAGQTRSAFARIADAVREMSEQSEEIASATNQIADGARRMRTDVDSIAVVAEQASAATQQASAATEQTSASTQQVAASAEQLASSAQELRELVSAFHLTASAP
jgi:methyl-accepting chemotaxis protein